MKWVVADRHEDYPGLGDRSFARRVMGSRICHELALSNACGEVNLRFGRLGILALRHNGQLLRVDAIAEL